MADKISTKNLFPRERSREEKSQPIGSVGFSVASFGFFAGSGYMLKRYYPELRESHFFNSSLDRVAGFRESLTRFMPKGFMHFVKTGKPYHGLKDLNTSPITAFRQFSKFDRYPARDKAMLERSYQDLMATNYMLQQERVGKLYQRIMALPKILRKKVIEEFNLRTEKGNFLRDALENNDTLRRRLLNIVTTDTTGEMMAIFTETLLTGEKVNRKVSTIGPMVFRAPKGHNFDGGQIRLRQVNQEVVAAINRRSLNELMDTHFVFGRNPEDIGMLPPAEVKSPGFKVGTSSEGAVNTFYKYYRLDKGVSEGAGAGNLVSPEVFKRMSKESGMTIAGVSAAERRGLVDLIDAARGMAGDSASIKIIPIMSAYGAQDTTLALEIGLKGNSVTLNIPLSNEGLGTITHGGSVKMAYNIRTKEGVTRLDTTKLMKLYQKSLARIIDDLRSGGSPDRAKRRAAEIFNKFFGDLPTYSGAVSDALRGFSVYDPEFQGAMSGRGISPKRKSQLSQELRAVIKAHGMDFKAMKSNIAFLDIETIGRELGERYQDKSRQSIWEVGLRYWGKDGKIVDNPIEGLTFKDGSLYLSPAEGWESFDDVSSLNRKHGGYAQINREKYAEIKGSMKEKDALKRLVLGLRKLSQSGAIIAGHQVEDFDLDVIFKRLRHFGVHRLDGVDLDVIRGEIKTIDTLHLARAVLDKGSTKSYRLGDLYERIYGRPIGGAHEAARDAQANREVWNYLWHMTKTKDIEAIKSTIASQMQGKGANAFEEKINSLYDLMEEDYVRGGAFRNLATVSTNAIEKGILPIFGFADLHPFGGAIGRVTSVDPKTGQFATRRNPVTGAMERVTEATGFPLRYAKNLHGYLQGAPLTEDSYRKMEKAGLLNSYFATENMLMLQRMVLEQGKMYGRLPDFLTPNKTRPHAVVAFADIPLQGQQDMALVSAEYASMYERGIDYTVRYDKSKLVTIDPRTEKQIVKGSIFNEKLRSLIAKVNSSPRQFISADEPILMDPRDDELLEFRHKDRPYAHVTTKPGHTRAYVIGVQDTGDTIELHYKVHRQLQTGDKFSYAAMKSTVFAQAQGSRMPYNAHVILPRKYALQYPYEIVSGAISHALATIHEKAEAIRNDTTMSSAKAERMSKAYLKRYFNSVAQMIRNYQLGPVFNVGGSEEILTKMTEVLGAENIRRMREGTLSDNFLVRASSQRTIEAGILHNIADMFTGIKKEVQLAIARAMGSKGKEPVDRAILEQNIVGYGFERPGMMEKFLKELQAVSEATIIDEQGTIFTRMVSNVTGPEVDEVFKTVEYGKADVAIRSGLRLNPDAVSRLRDISYLGDVLKRELHPDRQKTIDKAIDMFESRVYAAMEASKELAGLGDSMSATLQMLGFKAPDATELPVVRFKRGVGWRMSLGGQETAKTIEELMVYGANKGDMRGFYLELPVIGEGKTRGKYSKLIFDQNQDHMVRGFVDPSNPEHRVFVPSRTEVIRRAGLQRSIASSSKHLDISIMRLLEGIHTGTTKDVQAALDDFYSVALANATGKKGLYAKLSTAYMSGSMQAQTSHFISEYELMRSGITAPDPEQRAAIAATARQTIKPGTVVISENAFRKMVGDAHAEFEFRRFAGLGKKISGVPNAMASMPMVAARHPLYSMGVGAAFVDAVVLKELPGGKELIMTDNMTAKAIKADFDGDIANLVMAATKKEYREESTRQALEDIVRYHQENGRFFSESLTSLHDKDYQYKLKLGGKNRTFYGAALLEETNSKQKFIALPSGDNFKFFKAEKLNYTNEVPGLRFFEGNPDSAIWWATNTDTANEVMINPRKNKIRLIGQGLVETYHSRLKEMMSLEKSDLATKEALSLTASRQADKFVAKLGVGTQHNIFMNITNAMDKVLGMTATSTVAPGISQPIVQDIISAKHGFLKEFAYEIYEGVRAFGMNAPGFTNETRREMLSRWTGEGGATFVSVDTELAEIEALSRRGEISTDMYNIRRKMAQEVGKIRFTHEQMEMMMRAAPYSPYSGFGTSYDDYIIRGDMDKSTFRSLLDQFEEKSREKIFRGMFSERIEPGSIKAITDSIISEKGLMAPAIERELPALGAEGTAASLRRTLGESAYGKMAGAGKFLGGAALLYLAVNFFRPNQMGVLGEMPGRGGEVYDWGFSANELPRGVPLSVPQYIWESKAYVNMGDDTRRFERNRRLEESVYATLGIPVHTPEMSRIPSVAMTYHSDRSQVPGLDAILRNRVIQRV